MHKNEAKMKAPKATWSWPDLGTTKINVDGAFASDGGDAGIGIFIMDHAAQRLILC